MAAIRSIHNNNEANCSVIAVFILIFNSLEIMQNGENVTTQNFYRHLTTFENWHFMIRFEIWTLQTRTALFVQRFHKLHPKREF